jgi:hypothetical protein
VVFQWIKRSGSFGVISRGCEALIVSSRERRLGLPSPAHPLDKIWNFGKGKTGGMTAIVREVGSSSVSV